MDNFQKKKNNSLPLEKITKSSSKLKKANEEVAITMAQAATLKKNFTNRGNKTKVNGVTNRSRSRPYSINS